MRYYSKEYCKMHSNPYLKVEKFKTKNNIKLKIYSAYEAFLYPRNCITV